MKNTVGRLTFPSKNYQGSSKQPNPPATGTTLAPTHCEPSQLPTFQEDEDEEFEDVEDGFWVRVVTGL